MDNRHRDESLDHSKSVTYWIEAAKLGDAHAVQALFNRYFEQLVSHSRNRVHRKCRVEDEEDAALDAMYTFLAGVSAGKFPNVKDRNSLWPLLVDISIKNCQKQRRRQSTEKRNDLNNFGESWFLRMGDGKLGIADFAVDQFSDVGVIELEDIIEFTRRNLKTVEQQIFDLKLQQQSNHQIAKTLDLAPRTVDRKIANVILPKLIAALK